MTANLHYDLIKPDKLLADFVESFWLLKHHSEHNTEKIVVPDGSIDLFFFSKSDTEPFCITLKGLETKPNSNPFHPNFMLCAISFKPLAAEYILRHSIADILDGRKILPNDFWSFNASDLDDFEAFCSKAAQKNSLAFAKGN